MFLKVFVRTQIKKSHITQSKNFIDTVLDNKKIGR